MVRVIGHDAKDREIDASIADEGEVGGVGSANEGVEEEVHGGYGVRREEKQGEK